MRPLLAAALLALLACGKVNTATPVDSPQQQHDSAVADGASRGMVTVKVLDPNGTGSGIVGAEVVFVDSSATQRVATDGSGVATAFVEDGGSLTSISAGFNGNGALLQTVFGVKSGDEIVLGQVNSTNTNLGSFTVNFTPASAGSDGTSYQVFGPCGGTNLDEPAGASSATVTLGISSSCKLDPMELLVVARDTVTGTSLGFLDKRGVSFVSGGSTTLSGPYQPLLTLVASVTNASALASIQLNRLAPDNFGFDSGGNSAVDGSGDATVMVAGPTAGSAVMEVDLVRSGFGEQVVIDPIDGSAATYALDVGATALPWIGSAAYAPASRTLQIVTDTTDATTSAPDMVFTEIDYERATGSGGPIFNMAWRVVGDQLGDQVLPALPGELGALAPTGSDTIDDIEVLAFDTGTGHGYDGVRADPLDALDSIGLVRSLAGRQRLEEFSIQPPPPRAPHAVRAGSRGHWSPRFGRRGAAPAR